MLIKPRAFLCVNTQISVKQQLWAQKNKNCEIHVLLESVNYCVSRARQALELRKRMALDDVLHSTTICHKFKWKN